MAQERRATGRGHDTCSLSGLAASCEVEPPYGADLGRGTRVARYVILDPVGRGGMGEVYAAYDPELDRKVAIKVVREAHRLENATTYLRAEAQTLAQLAHPNLVAVHDVGWHDDRLFLAMQYVQGSSLADWLAVSPRSWREILEVFVAAGEGLAAAHRAGFLHQDFTLRNVLVGDDGSVRVADFGLACRVGPPSAKADLPEPARPRGTPAYVAPERVAGRRPDARSDQYSFSVALYRALTRDRPPAARTEPDAAGRKDEALALCGVPVWLRRTVCRGLAADPEARFPSMDALLAALSRQRGAAVRRFAVAAAALIAASSLAGAFLVGGKTVGPCPPRRELLAGVWDAGARTRLHAAFAAASLPHWEDSSRRVAGELDRYTARWAEMRDESCRATFVDQTQTARIHDLRSLCFDSRRAALRAFVDFHAAADPAALARAPKTVFDLAPLEECAERESFGLLALRELDADERRRLRELEERLEGLFSRYRAYRPVALEELDPLLAEAQRLDYPPLEARILELRAGLMWELGVPGALESQRAALAAAIRGGDRVHETLGFAWLAQLEAQQEGRSAAGAQWKEMAEAALESLGDGHDWALVQVTSALSVWALEAGQMDEAERLARRCANLAAKVWGTEDPRYATTLSHLATVVAGEHPREAIALGQRAARILEKALGRSHPALASSYFNVALGYSYLAEYAESLRWARRSYEIARADPEGPGRLMRPAILIGQLLVNANRPAEAVESLEAGRALAEERFGSDHPLIAQTLLSLAEARSLELRLAEADDLVGKARRVLAAALHPDHPLFLEGAIIAARVAVLSNAPAAAFDVLAPHAADLISAADSRRSAALGLLSLGQAEIARGGVAEARRHLEKAADLCGPGDAWIRAEARFQLAILDAHEERSRTADLAREALADLENRAESPSSALLRRSIEELLVDPKRSARFPPVISRAALPAHSKPSSALRRP